MSDFIMVKRCVVACRWGQKPLQPLREAPTRWQSDDLKERLSVRPAIGCPYISPNHTGVSLFWGNITHIFTFNPQNDIIDLSELELLEGGHTD